MDQLSFLNMVPWSFQSPFFPGSYAFLILDYSVLLNSAGVFFQKLHQKEWQGNFVVIGLASLNILIHTTDQQCGYA